MIGLNEEIDLVLEGSLDEYVKASDFSVTQATVRKKEQETQSRFAGLDKKLANEVVGVFRLQVIESLLTRARPVTAYQIARTVTPDFIIKIPYSIDEVRGALMKYLNYDEDAEEYMIDVSIVPDSATPAEEQAAIEQWGKERIAAAVKFVRGLEELEVDGEKYNISFKNYVKSNWEGREPQIEEFIKKATGDLVKKMSNGAVADAEVFPSKIGRDLKYSDFYEKILIPYINKNQRKIDTRLQNHLELHIKEVDILKEKYKDENEQDSKPPSYSFSPPSSAGTFSNSKRSWEIFTDEFLKPLSEIVNKARSDYITLVRSHLSGAVVPTGTALQEHLIKEDKLATITIDFNELRKQKLDESFLAMFGGWVEHILGAMFGNRVLPLSVKGSRRDVESFASALGGEKSYLDAVKRYGLDHPTTYKNKSKLDNAVKGFERETGLQWPFK